jgi:hypothetical protein
MGCGRMELSQVDGLQEDWPHDYHRILQTADAYCDSFVYNDQGGV